MLDEPRRHPRYLALLLLLLLATVPWPFIGRPTVFLLGLPMWLWWSMAWTAALSVTTAWGILRLWRPEAPGQAAETARRPKP